MTENKNEDIRCCECQYYRSTGHFSGYCKKLKQFVWGEERCTGREKRGSDYSHSLFYEEMFGLQEKQKEEKRKKRNWENRFQTWSNKESRDGSTSFGKCGYGVICDYCSDNSYGRPCVRALNEMIKDTGVNVDYENTEYSDVWNGIFN